MANPVNVQFDLDRGQLNQRQGTLEDNFRSAAIHFDPVTLTPGDRSFQLNIDFIEGENGATQRLELRTLGVGGAQNMPTTLATRLPPEPFFTPPNPASDTAPAGTHNFGAGVIIANASGSIDGFAALGASVAFDNAVGPLSQDFASVRPSAFAGAFEPNAFELFFQPAQPFSPHVPDLLDDPDEPLSFSGLTLTVEFLGGVGVQSVTVDSVSFNMISASIDILRAAPPLPPAPAGVTRVGTQNNDQLDGSDGYDLLIGLGGNDSLFGGDGDDVIYGGPGNDVIITGPGRNQAVGEDGDDQISASGGRGGSQLFGGLGNDTITGSFDNDLLDGGGDNDVLDPLSGNDVLRGGVGADVFVFRGDLRVAFQGVGDDRIIDFEDGIDKIRIETFQTGLSNIGQVLANTIDGPVGAVLTVVDTAGGSEGTVTLVGVPKSAFDAGDFEFV